MPTTTSITPTSTAQPLDRNPAAVYLTSLGSKHSQRNLKRYLDQMAALLDPQAAALTCNWGAIRFQHAAALRSQLAARKLAPSTVNGMLSALRGVLKAAWQLGYMTAEDYHRARAVENVKGETLPAGRDLAQGEILALADVCVSDDRPQGVRDAAIIGLLYSCGLRRAELAALDLQHIDMANGQIKVLHGKGQKDRTVYATNGAFEALRQWLVLRGDAPGALFLACNKAGQITRKTRPDGNLSGIGSQAVYNMLKRRALQAGVADFSPHDFRRTFVGDLLDRGADIVTVQKLAGHANVNTTARYDRRPEEAKRKAAQTLHFPWQGPGR